MTPSYFKEANIKEAKKPEGWSDEDCRSIAVWHGQQKLPSGKQYPVFVSFWKPTQEEIKDLIDGGGIYLSIVSNGLPPVSMTTKNPFIANEPDSTDQKN